MEISVSCPFCGEDFTVVIDLSVDGEQSYVEDCFVCCRPIQFTFWRRKKVKRDIR